MSSKSLEEWKNLVGKTFVDDVTVAAEEQHKVVCKTDLPTDHRIIKPGCFVTMDFKPERLNVHIDESNTIYKVKFG